VAPTAAEAAAASVDVEAERAKLRAEFDEQMRALKEQYEQEHTSKQKLQVHHRCYG
jgi:hypothetical protein